MKYIVWDYSGYDGPDTTICDSWEIAQEKIKELCQQYNLKVQYKNW